MNKSAFDNAGNILYILCFFPFQTVWVLCYHRSLGCFRNCPLQLQHSIICLICPTSNYRIFFSIHIILEACGSTVHLKGFITAATTTSMPLARDDHGIEFKNTTNTAARRSWLDIKFILGPFQLGLAAIVFASLVHFARLTVRMPLLAPLPATTWRFNSSYSNRVMYLIISWFLYSDVLSGTNSSNQPFGATGVWKCWQAKNIPPNSITNLKRSWFK